MAAIRYLLFILALAVSSQVSAINGNNPFAKTIEVESSGDWSVGEGEAALAARSSDGDWYHLHYDGVRLRLRVTNSSEDSDSSAISYQDFAVNDVKIDGERVDVFQWCLSNQDRHSRFLQQGLSVKKDICENQGDKGTFIMRLTKDTIRQLNAGKSLTFELKPFRTTVAVSYGLTDFSKVNAAFKAQKEARLAKSRKAAEPAVTPAAAAAPAAVSASVKPPAPQPKKKCKEKPPEGFAGIKPIVYICEDEDAKAEARASMSAKVAAIKKKREEEAALKAKKQREAELARLKREEELAREQAAIAESRAKQAELSSKIAEKMIGLCKKKWAAGEHRCYCEKYIEYAPAGISPDPSCGDS